MISMLAYASAFSAPSRDLNSTNPKVESTIVGEICIFSLQQGRRGTFRILSPSNRVSVA